MDAGGERVAIGLGSNLGDRHAYLEGAIAAIRSLDGVTDVVVSSFHETAPVGGPPQGDYLNAALALTTTLDPRTLFAVLQRIEVEAGRERTVRDAPRTLDVDLLIFGDRCLDESDLTLPHPRMTERAIVLDPLVEIAADLVHPTSGHTIAELHERLRSRAAEEASSR